MVYSRIAFVLCFFIVSTSLFAQLFPAKNYPQGYFRNPLNIPISLAGNFGELRSNHYHMGLDLRTQQRENLAVYAAADGYVARIKIEPAGFGRAIYINHPNGYTTLYCHLNDFNPALDAYLKKQQYALESWRVFLDIPPNMFPVKKGDFIAYSGNTGGSQGPHVHFEIRKTETDGNVNPMLFGFQIPDHTKPSIVRLAIYDRHKSTYEQSPKIVSVSKASAGYVTTPGLITVASDKVSFAITAYDTHTGSSNLNGIYQAVLYDNEQPVVGFQMDNISYNDTRYLNAHIDYRTKSTGGPYLQHLSELPGYLKSIYIKVQGDGVIDLSDRKVHDIRIDVRDAYGNTSLLNYKVQYNGAAITASNRPGRMFYPMMLDVSENKDCEFYLGEKCLYDSVHIKYASSASSASNAVSAVHTIGDTYIPLQDSLVIRIKPTVTLSERMKDKVVMQRYAGAKTDVLKVEWQGEWASAKFRDFGNFQLLLDETPPVIVPNGFANGSNLSKATRITFTVKDNLVKFKNVRATLDGNWIRCTNDKGRTFIYAFDEMWPRGEHVLEISAEDEAGNRGSATYRLTR